MTVCNDTDNHDSMNWPYFYSFLVEGDFCLVDLLHDAFKLRSEGPHVKKSHDHQTPTLRRNTFFRFPLYANKKKMSCVPFFSVPSVALWTAPFSSPPPSAIQKAERASFLHFRFLKNAQNTQPKAQRETSLLSAQERLCRKHNLCLRAFISSKDLLKELWKQNERRPV